MTYDLISLLSNLHLRQIASINSNFIKNNQSYIWLKSGIYFCQRIDIYTGILLGGHWFLQHSTWGFFFSLNYSCNKEWMVTINGNKWENKGEWICWWLWHCDTVYV